MKKMIVITTLLLTSCYEPLPSYISDKACYPMHSSPYSVACADKDFDNDGVKNIDDDFPYNKGMSTFKNKEKVCDCNEGYFCNQNGECQLLDNYHEICDGIDNDKDGRTDENIKIVSPNLLGVCKGNLMVCRQGMLSDPDPMSLPGYNNDEICDGLDNDCDGELDEDVVFELVPNYQNSLCQGLRYICKNNRKRMPSLDDFISYYENFEEDETSCDFEDNDCDGKIDENLKNACGHCEGEKQYPQETCNGIDEDCDGKIDEDTVGMEVCGDGFVCGNEECDDSNQNNIDSCANCNIAICGDGIIQRNEQCDDGNQINNDSCTNNCQQHCFNNINGPMTLIDRILISENQIFTTTIIDVSVCENVEYQHPMLHYEIDLSQYRNEERNSLTTFNTIKLDISLKNLYYDGLPVSENNYEDIYDFILYNWNLVNIPRTNQIAQSGQSGNISIYTPTNNNLILQIVVKGDKKLYGQIEITTSRIN